MTQTMIHEKFNTKLISSKQKTHIKILNKYSKILKFIRK